MKNENDQKIKIVNQTILDSTIDKNSNFYMNEIEFKIVFRNLKQNAHIERFFSNAQNLIDENFENVKFINVNKSRSIKIKNRLTNSKNKKFFITRTKKIVIKSTIRNFFEFEYVEIIVETQEWDRNRKTRKTRKKGKIRKKRKRKRNKQIASFIVTQKLQILKKNNDEQNTKTTKIE